MEEDLHKNLKNLGLAIKEIILNLPKDTIIKSNYTHYITKKFEYNGSVEWEEHKIEKVDENFIDFQISNMLEGSSELKEAKKSVKQFIKDHVEKSDTVKKAVESNLSDTSILSDSFLEGFIKKVNKVILEFSDNDLKLTDSNMVDAKIEELINCSVKELRGEPLKCELTINLKGIILKSGRIDINEEIEIIMPEKKDYDMKIIDNPFFRPQFNYPSAILVIRGSEKLNMLLDVRYYIKYFLAVLRLFKRGDVNCIGYNFKSEAILNENFRQFSLFQTQNMHESPLEISKNNYIFEKYLIKSLKNFINSGIDFNKLFSNKFLYLKIAYEHYCNALLSYNSNFEKRIVKTITGFEALSNNSNFEKRIVESIMGFEALFMKKGDKEGGAYKVRMNISRLFDSLLTCEPKNIQKLLNDNYGPENISKRIKDGFRVRNKYAHGEPISKTMLNEFMDEYGGIDKLLNYLLDYLRISIILMINNDKEDLLDLISTSLIKNESNKELTNAFSDAKPFILLNNIELTNNTNDLMD